MWFPASEWLPTWLAKWPAKWLAKWLSTDCEIIECRLSKILGQHYKP